MTRAENNDREQATTLLNEVGLRPTRQRVVLAQMLFSNGDRQVAAEELHAEAEADGAAISLATVYNTLRQFKSAGLLREVVVDSERVHYETNTHQRLAELSNSGHPNKSFAPINFLLKFFKKFFIGVLALCGFIVLFVVSIVVLIEMGIIPDTQVVSGKYMPDNQKNTLIGAGILGKNENIEYFYSEAAFSVVESGQFITKNRIVRYTELEINEIPIDFIESTELISKGSEGTFFDENPCTCDVYKIHSADASKWKSIKIFLPIEDNGNYVFISRLESLMKNK